MARAEAELLGRLRVLRCHLPIPALTKIFKNLVLEMGQITVLHSYTACNGIGTRFEAFEANNLCCGAGPFLTGSGSYKK